MPSNNSVNNRFLNQPVTVVTTSSYTALPTDTIIEVNFSGFSTITLPTPSDNNKGKSYTILDNSGAAFTNNITLLPASGLINGALSLTIGQDYGAIQVYNDGTNYFAQSNTSAGTTTTTLARGGWYLNSTGATFLPTGTTVSSSNSNTTPLANSAIFSYFGQFTTLASVGLIVGTNQATIVNTGLYRVFGTFGVASLSATLYAAIQVVKNGLSGTVIAWGQSGILTASSQFPVVVDAILSFNAGDTIDFRAGSNSSTNWQFTSIEISIEQLPTTASVSTGTTAFTPTINMQRFTSSGTYTPTTGTQYAIVEVIGGGGAGGGVNLAVLLENALGGGGGGGEYARGTFSSTQLGASQTITIGAGGTGVIAGNGNAGGTTSFGSLITANGGTGGFNGSSGSFVSTNAVAGGTGGTGGTVRTPGQPGGMSAGVYGSFALAIGGGGTVYGVGGTPRGAGSVGLGNAGLGYGGGGSGGASYSGTGPFAGGAGAAGAVIITEYIYNTTNNVNLLNWSAVAGTSQTLVSNNGYYVLNASLTTFTLPSSPTAGTVIAISGVGAGGWILTQTAGQQIFFGSLATTLGTGGSIASSNRYDAIEILCVSNTTFTVTYAVGNLTVV